MQKFRSVLYAAVVHLWYLTLVALGLLVLTLWAGVVWLENMIGHLPPMIVAGLPADFQRVLLAMAASTHRARIAMHERVDESQ